MTQPYRIALREDDRASSDGLPLLDDVVVKDVSMFRAELLSDKVLFLCCYLPGAGTDGAEDRIAFDVRVRKGRLEVAVTEHPAVATYEGDAA